MATKLEFAKYKLTAASIQWWDEKTSKYQPGTKFGCLGSLNAEPDVNTITIDCEGEENDSVDVVRFLELTISAHTNMANRRKIFGLNSDGLKEGYFGNDYRNLQGEGILTCELEDLYGRETLMIAFPRVKFTGGFRFEHENGQSEIAELEFNAKAYPVEFNGIKRHYIEVAKSVLGQENVTKWHTAFVPTLVEGTPLI